MWWLVGAMVPGTFPYSSNFLGIHDGPWGNKVDGLLGLRRSEQNDKSNSWRGLKKQNKETTNKTSGKAKQMKQGALGC